MGGSRKTSWHEKVKSRKISVNKAKNDKKSLNEYPNCIKLFPDCPEIIEEPKCPPELCKDCQLFKKSEFCKDIEETENELLLLFRNMKKEDSE